MHDSPCKLSVDDGPDPWVEVALAVVLRGSGQHRQVLVSRRTSEQVLGGFWEFPGGKIHAGESPESCALREVREEVGLTAQVLQALPILEHRYPHAAVRLYPFLCEHVQGQAQPLQVADCRWVQPANLTNYTFPPANAPLLAHLLRILST